MSDESYKKNDRQSCPQSHLEAQIELEPPFEISPSEQVGLSQSMELDVLSDQPHASLETQMLPTIAPMDPSDLLAFVEASGSFDALSVDEGSSSFEVPSFDSGEFGGASSFSLSENLAVSDVLSCESAKDFSKSSFLSKYESSGSSIEDLSTVNISAIKNIDPSSLVGLLQVESEFLSDDEEKVDSLELFKKLQNESQDDLLGESKDEQIKATKSLPGSEPSLSFVEALGAVSRLNTASVPGSDFSNEEIEYEHEQHSSQRTCLPECRFVEEELHADDISKLRYEVQSFWDNAQLGKVELAKDNDLLRVVAFKRLRTNERNVRALPRLIEHVRLMSQLEHSGITPIYDVGLDRYGKYFFVAKHVKGESLSDVISKLQFGYARYHQRYTFPERVRIMMKILRVICFCHKKGILHCNIRPSNVILGECGEVTVQGWEQARKLSGSEIDLWHQTNLEGSKSEDLPLSIELFDEPEKEAMDYLAPERAMEGCEDDPRSDLYSLGALFYEFLTLKRCKEKKVESRIDLAEPSCAEQAIFALKSHHPAQSSVPAELAHFLRHSLEKSPRDRFQTANEMLSSLTQLTDGVFERKCLASSYRYFGYRFLQFSNEHTTLTTLLGSLLFLLLVLGGIQALISIIQLF